jgi:hypothetical protein
MSAARSSCRRGTRAPARARGRGPSPRRTTRARDAPPGDQVARHDLEHLPAAGHARDRAQAPAHARGLDGLAHDPHAAGRLEGVVRAEAVGHVEDRLHGVVAADEGVRGALAAGHRQAVLGEVDADDAFGAGDAAAGDRAQADEAGAEDHARRAPPHLGDVERGADARGRAAGQGADDVRRRGGVDLGHRDLGQDRRLGEGARAHEVAQRLAAARQARGAVGQVPLTLLLADGQADVGPVRQAVDALAALRREQREDAIADPTPSTPSPTASTMPAPSWPRTVGA